MTRNLKIYLALLTLAGGGFNAMMVAGQGAIDLFGGSGWLFFIGGLIVMIGAITLELTDSRRSRRSGRGAIYSISFAIWAVITFVLLPVALNSLGLLAAPAIPASTLEFPLWPALIILLVGVTADVYFNKRRIKGMKKEDIFK